MGDAFAKRRWYQFTPGKLVLALLLVELCLLLLKPTSGWMLLLGIAIFSLTILFGLVWFAVAWMLKRPFQFGILSLLGLMCGIAILGGWFSWKSVRAKRQARVVSVIQKAGGSVVYEERSLYLVRPKKLLRPFVELLGDKFFADPVQVYSREEFDDDSLAHVRHLPSVRAVLIRDNMRVTDAGLEHLCKLPKLELLRISDSRVNDAGLKHVKGLASLKWLYLPETQFTDTGLVHLQGLAKLEWLDISYTQVTDHGLEHLNELTELEGLMLTKTQVTDAGLEYLQGMIKLKKLSLTNTRITDVGLVHLEGMTKLEDLWVNGTQITADGVQELQEALPNCKIYH